MPISDVTALINLGAAGLFVFFSLRIFNSFQVFLSDQIKQWQAYMESNGKQWRDYLSNEQTQWRSFLSTYQEDNVRALREVQTEINRNTQVLQQLVEITGSPKKASKH